MSQWVTTWRAAAFATLSGLAILPQINGAQAAHLDWRSVGQPGIDLHLCGIGSGHVSEVWFSPDGVTLYARTADGQLFETSDFESWKPSVATRISRTTPQTPIRQPEVGASVVQAAGDARRLWSLGRDLSVSEDNGATWTNVSGGFVSQIIGLDQHDVAVNPVDSDHVAVANNEGVWQSHDGGRSWSSLNEHLPNLPSARIISSAEIALEDGRVLKRSGVRSPWIVSESMQQNREPLELLLGTPLTAFARQGEFAYAGSPDGRIWVSRDAETSWIIPQTVGAGAIEKIYASPENPRAALALVAGPGSRIIRTVDGGAVWDDITGNLNEAIADSITADAESGTAYVATDRGVFTAHVDLSAFTPASAWQPLAGTLPKATATDIHFDSATNRLYLALRGYGLYSASVVHRNGALRVVSAADGVTRPAAPGSVVSVEGGEITAVRANNLTFPLLASDSDQAQIQVPFDIRVPGVDLSVELGGGRATLPLEIRSVSPVIFVDHDDAPVLVDADSGLSQDSATPLHPRQRVQLMATGLGRVQPDWPTGVAAPAERPPSVTAQVQAFLDGIPLDVEQATLATGYIGSYLVELQLPAILNAGSADLFLVVDGAASNHVKVAVAAE